MTDRLLWPCVDVLCRCMIKGSFIMLWKSARHTWHCNLVIACVIGSDQAMEFSWFGLCYGWNSATWSQEDNICWWCTEATASRCAIWFCITVCIAKSCLMCYDSSQEIWSCFIYCTVSYIKLYKLKKLPSVLWRCWLGGRKGIRPVKNNSGGVLVWLSVWREVQTCI